MQMKWKRVFAKTLVWIAAEIALNLLGLDNLADYSEFLFEREVIVVMTSPALLVPVFLRQSNPRADFSVSAMRFQF